ncbi:MAG: Crp/Fnr family transcriptional regulator [Propionibacteriaceae bacterium]|jgi:CRP-like cAMP-binding protein|nr:Crp/Fnr family transcriptional regulator [Propionibacteriaceae bacterium]
MLREVDPDARHALVAASDSRQVAKGEVLFHLGDEPEAAFLIVEGEIKLSRPLPGDWNQAGHENIIAIYGPGQVFGEVTIVDPGPRSNSATAITPAKLLFVPRAEVERLLHDYPSLSRALLKYLGRRLRIAHGMMSSLIVHDVPGRVADILLMLMDRFGERRADGVHVRHELTQADIAHMVGSSREAVNKALTEFATRGWIHVGTKSFTVFNEQRLRARIGENQSMFR